MVKTLLIVSAFILTLWATLAQAIDFRMELSKTKFYPGEQVTADFVLYAPDPVLEVEVVKFPEFRNFWSSNLTLRQGPLPLMPSFGAQGSPQVSIGSYLLSSMVGKKDLLIQPMKIAVRRPGDSDFQNLSSTLPAYQILPFPPLPDKDKAFFTGAVGSFTLTSDTTSMGFHKDEPLNLRVELQGQGNFAEVDEIPRTFPKEVEVLSKRTYTQGEGPYQTKIFEWTIAIHVEQRVDIPETPFLFFNPGTGKYESLTVPAVELLALPASPIEGSSPVTLPLETQWRSGWDLWHSRAFLWIQIALAIALLSFFFFSRFREFRLNQRRSPHFQRKQKWKRCFEEYRSGHWEAFLKLATELCSETLIDGLEEERPWIARAELLQLAEKKLPAPLLQRVKALFAAYDRMVYGPEKSVPSDFAPFLETLNDLRAPNKTCF